MHERNETVVVSRKRNLPAYTSGLGFTLQPGNISVKLVQNQCTASDFLLCCGKKDFCYFDISKLFKDGENELHVQSAI